MLGGKTRKTLVADVRFLSPEDHFDISCLIDVVGQSDERSPCWPVVLVNDAYNSGAVQMEADCHSIPAAATFHSSECSISTVQNNLALVLVCIHR